MPLLKLYADMPDLLSWLQAFVDIRAIWSHQETGNAVTFERDKAVKRWSKTYSRAWQEFLQQPIFRGNLNRDLYHQKVSDFFEQPVEHCDLSVIHDLAKMPTASFLSPKDEGCRSMNNVNNGCFADFCQTLQVVHDDAFAEQKTHFWQVFAKRQVAGEVCQRGGRARAEACLKAILQRNGKGYLYHLAKPLTAPRYSSRLSPHLTWGSLSIREVMLAVQGQLRFLIKSQNRQAWCHCK